MATGAGGRYAHPDEMLAGMTARQWGEWIAFHERSPIGAGRLDYLAAMICTYVAAAGGAKDVSVSDFMPVWFAEPPKPVDPQDIRDALKRAAPQG